MDKKARTILFKTYWTSQGWKREHNTPLDDFEYAKSKGVMFEPISFSLSEIMNELNLLVSRIDKDKIVKGFLSSLTNRRLGWRSAIASHVNAKLVLEGKREFYRHSNFQYKNEDVNVLNFERIKWGGVRHSDLLYNYIDLNLFEKETITEPTDADINTFKAILKCIKETKEGEYPSKLRDRLKEAMNGSVNERHTLMEILGCCEILKPRNYDRPRTGRHDWAFVEYWRGGDGYNRDFVKEYFENYLR